MNPPKCCGADAHWVVQSKSLQYWYCRECKKEVEQGKTTTTHSRDIQVGDLLCWRDGSQDKVVGIEGDEAIINPVITSSPYPNTPWRVDVNMIYNSFNWDGTSWVKI